ncbi:methyl-accepting chemotaxis protein [Bacteriovoracaceae bacterium]|nr:methyl-accepting chemotaxis protein [Bacteriovoracaceae bacterium]
MKSKPIKYMISLTFAVMVGLLIFVGSISFYGNKKSEQVFLELKERQLKNVFVSADIKYNISQLINVYRAIDPDDIELALITMNESKKIEKILADKISYLRNYALELKDKDNELSVETIKTVTYIEPKLATLKKHIKQMVLLSFEDDQIGVKKMSQLVTENVKQLNISIQSFDYLIRDKIENETNQIITLLKKSSKIIMFIIIFSVISSLFIFYRMIRNLNSRLHLVTNGLLEKTVNLSKNSFELSNVSTKISNSTSLQEAAVEESVSAINEISSMILQTVDNSKECTYKSNDCLENVHIGQTVLEQMKQSMISIDHSNKRLNEITAIIDEIIEKTSVINDIVFKTQLLSFNASIEAARAGNSGRGFAIVALEIGKLADSSGKASEQIKKLLHDGQKSVGDIVEEIGNRVDNGRNISTKCIEAFANIDMLMGDVSNMVDSISKATVQQKVGLEQTSTAMSKITEATHENGVATEESASIAAHVQKESNGLLVMIEDLERLSKKIIEKDT